MYYTEPTQVIIDSENISVPGICYKDEVIDTTSGKVYQLSKVRVYEKGDWCPLICESNEKSIIVWNRVLRRYLTKEEIDQYIALGIDEDWIPEYTFQCPMPRDGERILLRTHWGTDIDQCVVTTDGVLDIYQLDEYDTWDGVLEWAYMPE